MRLPKLPSVDMESTLNRFAQVVVCILLGNSPLNRNLSEHSRQLEPIDQCCILAMECGLAERHRKEELKQLLRREFVETI